MLLILFLLDEYSFPVSKGVPCKEHFSVVCKFLPDNGVLCGIV